MISIQKEKGHPRWKFTKEPVFRMASDTTGQQRLINEESTQRCVIPAKQQQHLRFVNVTIELTPFFDAATATVSIVIVTRKLLAMKVDV